MKDSNIYGFRKRGFLGKFIRKIIPTFVLHEPKVGIWSIIIQSICKNIIQFWKYSKDTIGCLKILYVKNLLKDIIRQDLSQFAFYVPNNMNNGYDRNPEFTDDYTYWYWRSLFLDSRFMCNRTVIIIYEENCKFDPPTGTNTFNTV